MVYIVIYKTHAMDMLPYYTRSISDYDFIQLRDDVFLLESNDDAGKIHQTLTDAIRPGDGVYVGRISSPAAWNGFRDEVNQWIFDKLTPAKDVLKNNMGRIEQKAGSFNMLINSVVGDLFLYACQLAKEHKKVSFPLEIVGMPTYLHGYIVALNSAVPNHFRCLPNSKKEVKVERYDVKFFGEITKDDIIIKCKEHDRDVDFVNESISRINNYFM